MPLNLDALIRLLVLVGLGMACALILQPFAEILLWAGLLAVILKPLQLWLQRHLRLGRWWSAGMGGSRAAGPDGAGLAAARSFSISTDSWSAVGTYCDSYSCPLSTIDGVDCTGIFWASAVLSFTCWCASLLS